MSPQILSQAAQLLQRGAIVEARTLLNDLLAREPANADALSLLGVAFAKSGDFATAADVLRRASLASPQHAGVQMNYGGVLKRLGRLDEAAACFERALALRPDAPVAALRQLGGVLLDLQRNDEAVSTYTRLLALQPQDALAFNDRGLAHLDLERFGAALADFDAALRINPRLAQTIGNKGLALAKLGRIGEALGACDQAIGLEPANAALKRTKGHVQLQAKQFAPALTTLDEALALGLQDATTWALRGEALTQLNRREEASASFAQALTLDPAHWEALIGLGMALAEASRFEGAADAFSRAATARPTHPLAYIERGRAALGMANFQAALYDADRALELAPNDIDALTLRMRVRRDLGDRGAALADCERALALSPSSSLYANRGVLLEELGRGDEAIASYEKAFELDPRNWIALQNFGGALVQLGRGDTALAKCDAKLSDAPNDSELLTTKGTILQALHRFDDAIAAFEKAIEAQADYTVAHFYRSLALLTQGRLTEGFQAYEWRRRGKRPLLQLMQFGQPEPKSVDETKGKRLLLYREQGLGDIIQFSRFARTFADRGAKVSVVTYPPLGRLLESLGRDIEIISDESHVEADFALPLMSAPALLGTARDSIPAQVPYLSAPEDMVALWRERLSELTGMRVGLVWSGNPAHVNDWARSIPFQTMRQLLSSPGATFVSLQKDVRPADEAALAESGVADYRVFLTSLAETAALISALDLVITVDTSVAHLAGALGKPVWILLPTRVDWRWMAEGETSPWYPTARLFRQKAPGAWDAVLGEVKSELQKLASGQQVR